MVLASLLRPATQAVSFGVRSAESASLFALDAVLRSAYAEEVVDRVLASPVLERTIDRALAGPLVDALGRNLARHAVPQRLPHPLLGDRHAQGTAERLGQGAERR